MFTFQKPRRKIVAYIFSMLLVCILFAGCTSGNSQSSASLESADSVPESSSGLETSQVELSTDLSSYKYVQRISGALASVDYQQMLQNSDYVVIAEYVGKSEPFMIRPVGGSDPTYFTDYYFASKEGEDATEKMITVRQKGGYGTYFACVNDDAAKPVSDNKYLLFLYKIDDGAEWNTEGDHYYLVGDYTGMWSLDENRNFINPMQDELIPYDVAKANCGIKEKPVVYVDGKPMNYRSQYLAELRESYESGEMPYEAYKAAIDREEEISSTFSQIMTKEEALAYELEIVEENGEGVTMSSIS